METRYEHTGQMIFFSLLRWMQYLNLEPDGVHGLMEGNERILLISNFDGATTDKALINSSFVRADSNASLCMIKRVDGFTLSLLAPSPEDGTGPGLS